MAITTKDLAQLCGVSRTTIHRALNGTGRIKPETKEMILQVAKEHGYRPDLLATGLANGQTYNIGVVVLDVKNRYFAQMLSTISTEAYARGYGVNITLHGGDAGTEREQLTRLADYRVDGIILSSVNEGEAYRTFLESLHRPIVSVDNRIADGIPFVGIDQRAAVREAVQRAAEKGYECIVFVCPPLDTKNRQNLYVHKERLLGYEEEMKRYPALRPECILSWDYLQKVDAILKEGKRTAFVCTADEYALEIMKDQKRAKRKAPVDYGITGFDNIDTLAYVTPQLSTISNVVDEVAKSAVEMLFAMIDADPEVEQMTGDSQRILPHRYMEGETL